LIKKRKKKKENECGEGGDNEFGMTMREEETDGEKSQMK